MRIVTNAIKEFEVGKQDYGVPDKQELVVTIDLEGPKIAIEHIKKTLEDKGFRLT